MYVYRLIEKDRFDGQDEYYLTHKKKLSQHEFEQLVMEVRNTLRPFMTIYGVLDYLVNEEGFKELNIQAEDEFQAEN